MYIYIYISALFVEVYAQTPSACAFVFERAQKKSRFLFILAAFVFILALIHDTTTTQGQRIF